MQEEAKKKSSSNKLAVLPASIRLWSFFCCNFFCCRSIFSLCCMEEDDEKLSSCSSSSILAPGSEEAILLLLRCGERWGLFWAWRPKLLFSLRSRLSKPSSRNSLSMNIFCKPLNSNFGVSAQVQCSDFNIRLLFRIINFIESSTNCQNYEDLARGNSVYGGPP